MKEELHCQGCGHEFVMGEKIHMVKIGILSRDLCNTCRDRVIAFIDAMHPTT